MDAKKINYYRLGKQYASRPFDDPLWEDMPAMTYDERIEFNRGYDDGLGSRVVSKMFVAALVIVVVCAVIAWVN